MALIGYEAQLVNADIQTTAIQGPFIMNIAKLEKLTQKSKELQNNSSEELFHSCS